MNCMKFTCTFFSAVSDGRVGSLTVREFEEKQKAPQQLRLELGKSQFDAIHQGGRAAERLG